MKNYIYVFITESLFIILLAILLNFSRVSLINALFIVGIFGLCLGLFLFIYSGGAFSIIGYSFRRYHYVMAPKRIKETMDESSDSHKSLKVRDEKYAITLPIIIVSALILTISILLSIF
ncbi:DUF3899 domain-containing protein [Macrococcoides canis]|uniref:DUF3899 domain-containing protein n=1 Tax=Macrococcoides canis TaxID=1855823 RepID=UPI0020B8BDE4|nr:DUF3899 domain-containing protein [Macrococcus canis]UTH12287.1 DUF3899 domain-containing protein [Macrococcus canis]